MTQYEAIKKMRELTREGKHFCFTFMSYDRTRQRSSGVIHVEKGRLRPRGREAYNQHAEIQEEYIDITTGEPRRFWHCCLMTFNGMKITAA